MTLLDRACSTALAVRCKPVMRVLGGHAAEILRRPFPKGVSGVLHANWQEGMGSSLALAARIIAQAPWIDAAFILLPDQPLVTAALLDSMLRQLRDPISIVLCDHGEATGPPALFHRKHFAALASLQGDQGAKAVAAKHPDEVATVAFPDGALDIDTPEAWERFTQGGTTSPPSGPP